MVLIRQYSRLVLILTATLSIVCNGRSARAQDDIVVEENDEAPVNVLFNMAGAEQIDQLLYGRFGVGGAGAARNKLDSALSLRIDDIERICGVTEAQKKKLQLAGRGDVKRFFDRVEETKRKFQTVNNNQFNNVWQEIQPLQTELSAGLFGDNSLFAKTVKRTLNEEQTANFESVTRQRSLARYRATVSWCVVQLDKSVGLSDEQRCRLVDLLVKETRPPRRFGQNDYWYIMLQASKLPEPSIKPIFDDVQWRILQRHLMQGKGMEHWLRTSGVIDDDKPAGPQPEFAVLPAVPFAAPAITIKRAEPQKKAVEKKKN